VYKPNTLALFPPQQRDERRNGREDYREHQRVDIDIPVQSLLT
jgi:hypothetical protein